MRLNSEKSRERFEQFVGALFESSTESELYLRLAELEISEPYKIRVKIVASPASLDHFFSELCQSEHPTLFGLGGKSYRLSRVVGRKNIRPIEVVFALKRLDIYSGPGDLRAIISVCTREQWRVLTSFIRSRYPRITPILLSQAELVQGIRTLRKSEAHQVKVRKFSATSSFDTPEGKKKKSIREWTDQELNQVLAEIREMGASLISIEVDFYELISSYVNVLPKATCKINRAAEIDISGSFQLAFESVALELGRIGVKKLKFLSGRGLRESGYNPRPLAIDFKTPLFDDLQVVRDFVNVLKKYPKSMHAVQHGNPYAHVRIMDLHDHSSFEVWAIPPHRIAMVPGLKASSAAFERLVDYIYRKVREGTLEEFREGTLEEYGRESDTASA